MNLFRGVHRNIWPIATSCFHIFNVICSLFSNQEFLPSSHELQTSRMNFFMSETPGWSSLGSAEDNWRILLGFAAECWGLWRWDLVAQTIFPETNWHCRETRSLLAFLHMSKKKSGGLSFYMQRWLLLSVFVMFQMQSLRDQLLFAFSSRASKHWDARQRPGSFGTTRLHVMVGRTGAIENQ